MSAYQWQQVVMVGGSILTLASFVLDHGVREKTPAKRRWEKAFVGFFVATVIGSCVAGHLANSEAEADRKEDRQATKDVQDKLNQVLAVVRENNPNASEADAIRLVVDELKALRARTDTLDARTKPRHLTDAQRQTLIELLKGLPPSKISIAFESGDAEIKTFANEIKAVFENDLRWEVFYNGLFSDDRRGIWMHNGTGREQEFLVIVEALVRSGVEQKPIHARRSDDPQDLGIYVGPRRDPEP